MSDSPKYYDNILILEKLPKDISNSKIIGTIIYNNKSYSLYKINEYVGRNKIPDGSIITYQEIKFVPSTKPVHKLKKHKLKKGGKRIKKNSNTRSTKMIRISKNKWLNRI